MSLRSVSRLLFVTSQQASLSSRAYSRWTHRRPARTLLPFEPTTKTSLKKEKVIDLQLNSSKSAENEIKSVEANETKNIPEDEPLPSLGYSPEKSQEIKSKRDEKLKKRKFYLSQQKVFDDNNEIIFEKCKDNDGRISTLLTNLKSKKDRLRTQQILVEGWRLIVEGLEAKCMLKYVIFSRQEYLDNLRPFLPKTGVTFLKIPYKEISLWSDVETSPGVFGIFEMPTPENVKGVSKPLPLHLICDNIRMPGNLGAILRVAVGAGCDKMILTKGCVDLWDPKVMRSAAGAHFRLPIHPAVDWEDIPKLLHPNTSIFIADSNIDTVDEQVNQDKFQGLQIPVLPYYGVDYASLQHITLVIGGETEGISEESYRLALTKNGLRLNIPLQRGIDSLNTGMAAAVIAFEIKKQLIQAWTRIKLERQALQT